MNKVNKLIFLFLIVFLFSGCISYDDPVKEMFCDKFGNNSKYCQEQEDDEETPNEDDEEMQNENNDEPTDEDDSETSNEDDDEEETEQEPSCQSTDNYTGYYADINNDGIPEGVIFVDLMKCANNNQTTVNGTWNGSHYSYRTNESTKEYDISETNYEGSFGTKPIISVRPGSTGYDRFYVMALEDLDNNRHYWYQNAYDHMPLDSSATRQFFYGGKYNTYTMINNWNEEYFGTKTTGEYADIWGIIQNQTKYPITTDEMTGWFVPSKEELNAFADSFKITLSNYTTFGLNVDYWSSSQSGCCFAYAINFNYYDGSMVSSSVWNIGYIRLAITF